LNKSSQLESMGSGTTVKGIRLDEFEKLQIALPSFDEQREIVEILQAIENVIYGQKQDYADCVVLKKSLMDKLLTGKVRVPL
jgi:type I restriction enzyme S subunit